MIAGRMLHAAHGYHAVSVTLQTVAGSAENLIALFTAPEQIEIHRQREIVRFLGHEEFVVGQRTARHGIFDERALRPAIFKKWRRRKRPILRLVGHVLPEILATGAENQANGSASGNEVSRGVNHPTPRKHDARGDSAASARCPPDETWGRGPQCKQRSGPMMRA